MKTGTLLGSIKAYYLVQEFYLNLFNSTNAWLYNVAFSVLTVVNVEIIYSSMRCDTMGSVIINPVLLSLYYVLLFPAWLTCLPWWWRYHVPPNICTRLPNYIAHDIAEYQYLIYTTQQNMSNSHFQYLITQITKTYKHLSVLWLKTPIMPDDCKSSL